MSDIKYIRANQEAFDKAMNMRGLPQQSKYILEIDSKLLAIMQEAQTIQAKRNQIAAMIAKAKVTQADISELMKESETLKDTLLSIEKSGSELRIKLDDILSRIPNMPLEDVPYGEDDKDNIEVKKVGNPRVFDFTAKAHWDIGEKTGVLDFETAGKISGSRFVIMRGLAARLERALINFLLDMHVSEFGYTEYSIPTLVKDNALYGTGQLPKFAEDLFTTDTGLRLIPTAEVVLTNLVNDTIVQEIELPMRFTAHSLCFRSEIGSAGRDTRGIIRQYQFDKVELVSITTPQESRQELERMLSCAEEALKRLKLPYRVMLLCSKDMGFSAAKTYDIEVWLPGQACYREISSCSNCLDFQARRMKARYKEYTTGKNKLVHTLNGSALPIGRLIAAIMENYQNADGSFSIPDALMPYMNIEKKG